MKEEPLGLGAAHCGECLPCMDRTLVPSPKLEEKKKAFRILAIGLQVNINCVQEGQGL